MKYKALIIGCGSIGALKPDACDSPTSKHPMTHANAILRSGKFDLSLCDTDGAKLTAAGDKWAIPSRNLYLWNSHSTQWNNAFDVVVVAVPTEYHEDIVEIVARLKAKLIIIEKPVGLTGTECGRILHQLDNAQVIVNYTRRFTGLWREIQGLSNGGFGTVYGATWAYGGGLRRDGCHALDALHFMFGKCLHIGKVSKVRSPRADDNLSFQMVMEGCPSVSMVAIDDSKYCTFDAQFYTDAGRISFYDYGAIIERHPLVPETNYAAGSYNKLSGANRTVAYIDLQAALTNLYVHVVDLLEGRASRPLCDLEDALTVHHTIEEIIGNE